MNQLHLIGVIGAGTMGSGIAQVAATAGHKVFLFDSKKEFTEKGIASIQSSLKKLVEKNKISETDAKNIINRITIAEKLEDLSNVDFVIEAIVEDEKIKSELFVKLETIVSTNTIFGTNTSSFSIKKLSENLNHKKRFIGIHFFNPAVLMELVEIIYSSETESELPVKIKKLLLSWKKIPVIVKDTPGFIVNRIARPYYLEAMKILEEKIADVPTIDWAMKEFGKFKMGPFELMDLIGLDINYAVSQSVYKSFNQNPRFMPSEIQNKMVNQNLLGRKTGKGFYDYSNSSLNSASIKNEILGKEIFLRIISTLINEAAFALEENVASYEDIEIALQKGANYPKGLLTWGKDIGFKNIIDILNKLKVEKQNEKYSACPLLLKIN